MNFLTINIYCCVLLFLLISYSESLRCRSGNQQSNDHLYRVMQNCRKKYSGNESKSSRDYTSSNENDSSDEDSATSSSFEEELFFGNNNRKSGGSNSRNGGNYGQSSGGNYGDNRRNDRQKQDSSNNRSHFFNSNNYTSTNERGNGMLNMNERRNYRNGMQNHDSNIEDRRERAECITQCFFDELNLVDQRGFPERGSVMEMMTRGIQNPAVRDFIEESISECFHYINSDMNNREKCAFSKNLMNCFADKGKERCEDWDDK